MSLRKIKRRLSHTFRFTVDGSLNELAEQLTIDETSSRRFLTLSGSDSSGDALENGGKYKYTYHLFSLTRSLKLRNDISCADRVLYDIYDPQVILKLKTFHIVKLIILTQA